MSGFTRQDATYRLTVPDLFAINDIEPPFRTTRLEENGFDRDRMVSILKGFVADREIPPVDLLVIPPLRKNQANFRPIGSSVAL
jgi:hypothetical protein